MTQRHKERQNRTNMQYFVIQGQHIVCWDPWNYLFLCCELLQNLCLKTLHLLVYPLYCTYISKTVVQITCNCDFKCIWILTTTGCVGEFFHNGNKYSLVLSIMRNCMCSCVCVCVSLHIIRAYTYKSYMHIYIHTYDFLRFGHHFPLYLQPSLSDPWPAYSGREERNNGKLRPLIYFFSFASLLASK